MQDTTKNFSKNLKQTFQSMFRISAVCGVFPFVFADNKLTLSYMLLPHTITNLIFICCIMSYVLHFRLIEKSIKVNNYAWTISYLTPLLLPFLVPTVSVFWLWINLKKFSKIFLSLERLEEVTLNYNQFSYRKCYLYLFSFLIPLFTLEYTLSNIPPIFNILISLIRINAYLVLVQFTSILAIIRNHYLFLEDTLCSSTAMEWTQCHEILGSCCEIINRCYSPQLFVFVFCSFSFSTSTVFLLTAQNQLFSINERILAISWVVIYILTVLVIVFNCQETVQKAKRFDKALYRLVLNDSTKQLLGNKRIRHHFKAKNKVEFSAMGFFHFDYSLIGRMTSTATTYIIIMVQFTP